LHGTRNNDYVLYNIPDPSTIIQLPLHVLVQNVAGMRCENRYGHGPKSAIIKQFIRNTTDFLILTETKSKRSQIFGSKIKFGLKAKLSTSQTGPNKGVAIYSNAKYTVIRASVRESTVPGHYVMAIFRYNNTHILVAGVYGPSDRADGPAAAVFQELNDNIKILTETYHVHRLIVAGDFNVNMKMGENLTKPRATAQIEQLMMEHHLYDIGLHWGGGEYMAQKRELKSVVQNRLYSCRYESG